MTLDEIDADISAVASKLVALYRDCGKEPPAALAFCAIPTSELLLECACEAAVREWNRPDERGQERRLKYAVGTLLDGTQEQADVAIRFIRETRNQRGQRNGTIVGRTGVQGRTEGNKPAVGPLR